MKRIIILSIICMLLLCACAPQTQNEVQTAPTSQTEDTVQTTAASGTEVRFTDDLGREVTVDNPQRVICLTASYADVCAWQGELTALWPLPMQPGRILICL